MLTLQEFVNREPHFIVAHRGSSGNAPENTLAAIQQALDEHADMVEVDVQFSSDEVPLVLHDPHLGRTTNGKGKVENFSAEDIRELDAGSWFAPSYAGEKVPLLDEALAVLAQKAYISIEIKPYQSSAQTLERLQKIYSSVVANNLLAYTLFLSFDHSLLQHIKEIDSRCHTAALHIPGDNRSPIDIAKICGCEGYVCSIKEASKQRVTECTEAGLFVGVYGIGTPADLKKALRRNVKAFVTNYPALLRQWLSSPD